MDFRTGWMPVCGAALLCLLSFVSIRVWQGADLGYELANICSLVGRPVNQASLHDDFASLPVRPHALLTTAKAKSHPGANALFGGKDFHSKNRETFELAQQIPVDADFDLTLFNRTRVPAIAASFRKPVHHPAVYRDWIASRYRWLAESCGATFAWYESLVVLQPTSVAIAANEPINNDPIPNDPIPNDPIPNDPIPNDPIPNDPIPVTEPKLDPTPNTIPFEESTAEDRRKTTAWPLPEALLVDLNALRGNAYTSAWAQATIRIISGLEHLDGIADPAAKTVFEQLTRQLDQLEFIIRQVSTTPAKTARESQGDLAIQLRHVRYALQRRLAVWPVAHELAGRNIDRIGLVDHRQVGSFLLASRTRINTAAMDKGWSDYLKIDEAAQVFNSLNPNEYAQRKAARTVLARTNNPALSIAQKNYLVKAIDGQTMNILKTCATDLVEMEQFLQRLESQELHGNGATEFYLNDHYQSLLWSDDPEYQQLAERLQTHYRNSNFRISIHEDQLNRMIPDLPDTQEPFRDTVMSAQVRGTNRISNQLRVGLIPDPNQISLRLETIGNVHTRTTATSKGVVVENEGNSRFRIIKRLALGEHGFFAYRPETTSQVKQQVVGLRSNLDIIPPLGWVKRRIAQSKIQQQAPETKRYAQNQLESKAESRFDEEIEQRLHELETMLTENLLHPLIAMDLEPDPVQISTTADRINMRYRLAGRDQMASSTARPRAQQNCLMSMQIHESAVNNILSRFELAGKKFNNQEMAEYLNRVLQTDFIVDDGKQRNNAEFEFAPFDPIRIDFEESQIAISVNLKSLRVGNGKRWKNLVLKVLYDPQIEDGFRLRMTQSEEGLRIKGQRFNAGDQLAIGVICEVLFPNEFAVSMMPVKLGQQLTVNSLQATQFVVSNGWIGISVDDPNRIANSFPMPEQHRQNASNGSLFNRR